jgi:hypothetical protein
MAFVSIVADNSGLENAEPVVGRRITKFYNAETATAQVELKGRYRDLTQKE